MQLTGLRIHIATQHALSVSRSTLTHNRGVTITIKASGLTSGFVPWPCQHAFLAERLLSHRALPLRRRLLQISSTEFSSLTSFPFHKFSLALAKAYLLGFRRVLNTKFDRCRALFHHETLDSWHKYLLPEIGATPRPIQRVCKRS